VIRVTPFTPAQQQAIDIERRKLERTRERALGIVEEIRQGKVSIRPADPDKCRWCDVKDVCRVDQAAAEELVQVEEAE
jgi:hypothetical protein